MAPVYEKTTHNSVALAVLNYCAHTHGDILKFLLAKCPFKIKLCFSLATRIFSSQVTLVINFINYTVQTEKPNGEITSISVKLSGGALLLALGEQLCALLEICS